MEVAGGPHAAGKRDQDGGKVREGRNGGEVRDDELSEKEM